MMNVNCPNWGPICHKPCWHAAMTNLCDGCRANIYAFNSMTQWYDHALLYNAANSLAVACHHQDIPQNPISGFSHLNDPLIPTFNHEQGQEANELTKTYEDEINSWLLPNPDNNVWYRNLDNNEDQRNNLLSHEVDGYLNHENYIPWTEDQYGQLQVKSMQQVGHNENDAVMPVQYSMQEMEQQQEHIQNFLSETEHNASTFSFIYPPPSSMTDSAFTRTPILPGTISNSFSNTNNLPLEGAFDQFSLSFINTGNIPGAAFSSNSNFGLFPCAASETQFELPPMSRKEKVLRYLEKKKARKFDKKIRYASRKTYAEARYRIRGRFARKSDMELKLDQDSFRKREEDDHGVVPSL